MLLKLEKVHIYMEGAPLISAHKTYTRRPIETAAEPAVIVEAKNVSCLRGLEVYECMRNYIHIMCRKHVILYTQTHRK